MAIPKLKKSWQFDVSNYTAASGTVSTDYKNLMFTIKSLLVGTGTSPWVALRSSDSVSVSNSDLWATAANLIWTAAATAHSWIVLRQSGILSNFQLCIDLASSGWGAPIERGIVMAISPAAGFTGGTTTARPTATDEIVVRNGEPADGSMRNPGDWFYRFSASFSCVVHAMVSSDGACTRIVMHGSGVPYCLWLFDQIAEAPTEMTWPFVVSVWADQNNNSHLRYVDLNDNSYARGAIPGPQLYEAFFTSEGFNNSMVGEQITVANDLSAQWPLMGVGLAGEQGGARGRLGGLSDLWWGSTGVGEGNTYPNDSTRKFAQFGHLVFPWDGTIPTINTPPGTDTQRAAFDTQPALPPAPRIVPVSDD